MNDDAIFLTYRVVCIAGKPPPTGYAFSQSLSFCARFARLADLGITMSSWERSSPGTEQHADKPFIDIAI